MENLNDFVEWLVANGTVATDADADQLLVDAAKYPTRDEQRIDELTDKIPAGTFCSEDNCCGGFLTQAEADELERLVNPK